MKTRVIFSILLTMLCGCILAQVAGRPSPQKLYNNLSREFPQFLFPEEAAKLEKKLETFSNETSNQICVVVIDDLNGMEAADYATKLINEWGIGKAEKNNGVVILIKPTGGQGGRDLFIGVGYGLEGAIPDLATKRIREEEMYPYLKKNENFTALDKATDKLMQLAKGEINVKDYTRKKDVSWGTVIIIFIVIIILIAGFGRRGGHTYYGGGRHHWGGGGFGGRSSGGGGWGGFGGGHSGGGGSGGRW